VFGTQTRYDLRAGFPLLTTKKVLFPAVVRELLWFLRGSTNINDDLTQHTPIWDAWADAHGELGPIYGYQWRNWGGEGRFDGREDGWAEGSEVRRKDIPHGRRGIDQIQQAIDTIKKDPSSRRIIVSAWNVADIPKMRLPPCHAFFQFYVHDTWLDCQLYQRSADLALGVPFNIASYALLMAMIAQECKLAPRHFVHTLGAAHIYLNHVEGVKTQLAREPHPLPRLVLANKRTLELDYEDITLENYQHHPFIKFPVAV
jgi:thymidylate synthase